MFPLPNPHSVASLDFVPAPEIKEMFKLLIKM